MNSMLFLAVAALVGLTAAVPVSVKFLNCDEGGAGKPVAVYVDPCDNPAGCGLKKGTNSTITIDFIPNGAASSVTPVVHGVIAGIPIPFPLKEKDGCKNSGLTCPLKAGVKVTYHQQLEILTAYPSLKLEVKWQLKDEKSKDLACIEIPVQIKG
eukprot:gene19909-21855_t